MILNPEQLAAVALLHSGKNVFLTGSAGTGKSTVTTAFVGSSLREIHVAATTGIAAVNLRDQFQAAWPGREITVGTVYRWAGIGLGPKEGQKNRDYWQWWAANWGRGQSINRICDAECLIIDEVSMLPGRILDYLEYHCRMIRGGDKPFGGLQVVAVGDFLQLPPVNKNSQIFDWAFMTEAWSRTGFTPAILTQVHRQADPELIRLLGEFRVGRLSARTMGILQKRVIPFVSSKVPRLLTHNDQVDKWNNAQLASLEGQELKFLANVTGDRQHERDWLIKNMVTPFLLCLKEGARVMITANIMDAETGELKACNGTTGTVISMVEHKSVTVGTDDGIVIKLEKKMWDFDPQVVDSAKFFQIPLRPAWACTIHKAQGLSLDTAMLSICAARNPGQAYVGVSRVRTLEGLYLKDVPGGVIVSPAAIAFHADLGKPPEPAPADCLY